ncbi:MAG: TatD family hydrolase [Patescibacteria group bacterium]|nr:TatD family hydrolase [Patescibacteria group bacterium]
MFFDTHAHLNFAAFTRDREDIIKRCLKDDISLINVGTNFFTSERAVEIAEKYEQGVYAAVGLHPINLDTGLTKKRVDKDEDDGDSPFEKEFDYEKYKKLAQNEKVVAIGEVGLDYYWKPKTKKKLEQFKSEQNFLLHQEIRLAAELDLPSIIHCRMAHEEMLNTLKELSVVYNKKLKGVIHCFTGDWEQAKKYMRLGFLIGFNGIIFKIDLKEVIEKMPLDKILIETDCPYLTPPNSNKKKNDPFGVMVIAQEIADIKELSLEEIANQTTENARNLFIKTIN